MSELSNEHLQELYDAIKGRLEEFELPMPSAVLLTKGAVRVCHDVIKKWYEEKEESWAMQRISDVTITAEMAMKLSKQGYEMGYEAAKANMSPARDEAADKWPLVEKSAEEVADAINTHNGVEGYAPVGLSTQAVAALGPEHTVVTPLKVAGRPMDEMDRDEFMHLGLNSEEKSAVLRDIIAELQMLSVHGEMLTMADWDARKPPTLPKAQAALMRYQMSWGQLAEYARLKYEGRGKAK